MKVLNDVVSKHFTTKTNDTAVSQMLNAVKVLEKDLSKATKVTGQYDHFVEIRTDNVRVRNTELDCEFEVEFDDDTEANEAEITIYNLTDRTINQFKNKAKITITAGYGTDTGVIFSGFIIAKKTYRDGADKVTTITAVDDMKRVEKEVESISYAAGRKASYILKDLCKRVGLPIAVFKTTRDYTYTDEVTVDGDLSKKIKEYATICGVSAYVCKSKIYVRPLKDGDNTRFKLSADTGLLSAAEFEEISETDEYTDVIKGFEVECLLQHRVQTASIIELNSKAYKGTFRVQSGEHYYDGSDFITKMRIIQV